jgi:hypothetical protein
MHAGLQDVELAMTRLLEGFEAGLRRFDCSHGLARLMRASVSTPVCGLVTLFTREKLMIRFPW